jgi:predicted double-glycine peptidase
MEDMKTIPLAILMFVLTGCVQSEDLFRQGEPTTQRHTLKELRDTNVVKQEKDYSCGAAALATLMIYYFGDKITEEQILNRLSSFMTEEERQKKTLVGFSLLDLKKATQSMGYRAAGFKLSAEQLTRLTAPVMVFVEPRGYKHFAIFRGMSWRRVYLADPARGNLRMSLEQFLDEWGGIIFVLGKKGEERIKDYPLAIHHNQDYGQPELLRFNGQLDLGTYINMLPFR